MSDQTLRKIAEESAVGQSPSNSDLLEQGSRKTPVRPRNTTMLKLQWLAERVRKCRQIKEQVAAGTYNVDSRKVARAVLGLDQE